MRYAIVSAGSHQGLPAYIYVGSEIKFDTEVPEHLNKQDCRVVIREFRPDQEDEVLDFIERCRSVRPTYFILETQAEKPTPAWRVVNWIILHTAVSKYRGTPANELMVYFDSEEPLTTLHNPVVWVHREKEQDLAKFLKWAGDQAIQIRILRV